MAKRAISGLEFITFYNEIFHPKNATNIILECATKAGFDDVVYYQIPKGNEVNYEHKRVSVLVECCNDHGIIDGKIPVKFDIDFDEIDDIQLLSMYPVDRKVNMYDLFDMKMKVEGFLTLLNEEGFKLKEKMSKLPM